MSFRLSSVLLLFLIFFNPMFTLSPPDQPTNSKKLTQDLLSLDLGYNILSQEALRRSFDSGIDRIGFDYDDEPEVIYEYLEDDDPTFKDEDEDYFSSSYSERLPSAHELVSDDEVNEGPSPFGFWLDPGFWGGRNQPTWSSFGGRPQRRPRKPKGRPPYVSSSQSRSRPKKKIFGVGDQHQCETGACEFFLFCWLSGGSTKSGCGGFLFSCCERSHRSAKSDVELARVSSKNKTRHKT